MQGYFADGILSPGQFFLYCAAIFLALSLIAGLAIFLVGKLARHFSLTARTQLTLRVSILAGCVIVGLGVVFFMVIPARVDDSRWETKQQECATQAGYSSPAEDNSSSATAESQAQYRLCLEQL